MKTIQTTIDDRFAEEVSKTAQNMGKTVEEYLRYLLESAVTDTDEKTLERLHREAYERCPVKPDEFPFTENDQAWPEW